jgi:hypothetical protein
MAAKNPIKKGHGIHLDMLVLSVLLGECYIILVAECPKGLSKLDCLFLDYHGLALQHFRHYCIFGECFARG